MHGWNPSTGRNRDPEVKIILSHISRMKPAWDHIKETNRNERQALKSDLCTRWAASDPSSLPFRGD